VVYSLRQKPMWLLRGLGDAAKPNGPRVLDVKDSVVQLVFYGFELVRRSSDAAWRCISIIASLICMV